MLGNMIQNYLYPSESRDSEQVVSEQPKQCEQQFFEPGSNRSESPTCHNTGYNYSNETSTWGQSNPWNKVTNTQHWSQKPSKAVFWIKEATVKI